MRRFQALALSSGYDSSLWAAAMHQQGLAVTKSFQGFPVVHTHYAFVCWSQGGLQSPLTIGYRQTMNPIKQALLISRL